MVAKKPLLSICLIGRNDNYMPDFLYRMSITINFLAHSLKKLDRLADVEVVVVDWKSKKPLTKALTLSPEGAQLTKFVYVHPENLDESLPNEAFRSYLATNTGFRHSLGEYIGFCGADTIFPVNTMAALFRVLEGQSFLSHPADKVFFCGRFDIASDFVNTAPDIQAWERYLLVNSWHIPAAEAKPGFLCGNAGFIMSHRDIVFESTGFLEKLDPCWGWADIEYTFRLMGHYRCYDLLSNGVQIYNMEHDPNAGARKDIVKKLPPFYLTSEIEANSEQWGVPKDEIEISTAVPKQEQTKEPSQRLDIDLHDGQISKQVSEFISRYDTGLKARWGEVQAKEQFLIQVLASVFKHHYVTNYLEIGCRKSKKLLFSAFTQKHLEITGIDRWNETDSVSGPHNISSMIGATPVGHRGDLRLMNRSTVATLSVLNRERYDAPEFELIVINEDTVTSVTEYLDACIAIMNQSGVAIVNCAHKESFEYVTQYFANTLPQINTMVSNEYHTLVASRLLVQQGKIELNEVVLCKGSFVDKNAYRTVVNFTQAMDNIPDGDIVLFGYGSIAKLMFPHIRHRVSAIIDKSLSEQSITSIDNKPVICAHDLDRFSTATVVITSMIHDEEIREELSPYNNEIHTLCW